jgi:hypothetical protein
MSERKTNPLIAVACLVAVWVAIINLAGSALVQMRGINRTSPQSLQSDLPGSSREDTVASKPLVKKSIVYSGEFESPFRVAGKWTETPENGGAAAVAYSRKKISLKGILSKEKPLAILEDDQGKTYICGAGEQVLDQKIVNIGADRVTLRDRRGTYDVAVQEK